MDLTRPPTPNRWARTIFIVGAFAVAGCGSDSSTGSALPTTPSFVPTSASVEIVDTELAIDTDAAISPSGGAIVVLHPERGWCLRTVTGTDADIECIEAESKGSASDRILWRPDERAVAITWGSQNPMSIIDYDTGSVTETILDDHRFLAWSPDGEGLLGLAIESDDQYSVLDPTTLETSKFADFDGPDVPRLFWVSDDLIVGSSTSGPEVFVLDQGSGERRAIEGGLGKQDVRSLSADGSIAVAFDDDVVHGGGADGDPVLLLFDIEGERSSGVALPPGLKPAEAQLSADGTQLLVVAERPEGSVLITGTIDGASLDVPEWVELIEWPRGSEAEPAAYVSNVLLRWTGGDTAWLITENEGLARILLSR